LSRITKSALRLIDCCWPQAEPESPLINGFSL
jgi:hypothetical protein